MALWLSLRKQNPSMDNAYQYNYQLIITNSKDRCMRGDDLNQYWSQLNIIRPQ